MTYAEEITITSTHTSTGAANKIYTTIHTESIFLDKTKQSHTKSRQNNLHSVHARPCRIYEHTLFLTRAATQQTFPQTPHSHYNRHKTNMRHIHTYIVSMHLATRGNNKILRTPPPHISSSEERLPRLTCRTLVQLRTIQSHFLKSYLHSVNAKSHPSPLCPLCYTRTHDTHHLFNCTHKRTTLSLMDLWTDPAGVMELLARWRDMLAGGPKVG